MMLLMMMMMMMMMVMMMMMMMMLMMMTTTIVMLDTKSLGWGSNHHRCTPTEGSACSSHPHPPSSAPALNRDIW